MDPRTDTLTVRKAYSSIPAFCKSMIKETETVNRVYVQNYWSRLRHTQEACSDHSDDLESRSSTKQSVSVLRGMYAQHYNYTHGLSQSGSYLYLYLSSHIAGGGSWDVLLWAENWQACVLFAGLYVG